jgi:hypothetical protein
VTAAALTPLTCTFGGKHVRCRKKHLVAGCHYNMSRERVMNEEAFNISIRKFLKHFGVTAQREIEQVVRRGLEDGSISEDQSIPVRATLTVGNMVHDFHIDSEITLG